MTIEYYLLQAEILHRQPHYILANDDTINEELEHPHESTIILHKEEATPLLDDDIVNDILEHQTNPVFIVPYA